MKKNNFVLIVFLLIGLIAGSLAAHLLAPVPGISFLTQSTSIAWEPQLDLDALKYEIHIQVKISVLSLIGVIAAIWIYRKL